MHKFPQAHLIPSNNHPLPNNPDSGTASPPPPRPPPSDWPTDKLSKLPISARPISAPHPQLLARTGNGAEAGKPPRGAGLVSGWGRGAAVLWPGQVPESSCGAKGVVGLW